MDNKQIARRTFEEGWGKGNLDMVDEIAAPDMRLHARLPGDFGPGPEGIKKLIRTFRAAFPDLSYTVDFQLAEGDRVLTRWSATGTHRGEFMGIQPTNRRINYDGMSVQRFRNGKIVEAWANVDMLGLLQQIGAGAPKQPQQPEA